MNLLSFRNASNHTLTHVAVLLLAGNSSLSAEWKKLSVPCHCAMIGLQPQWMKLLVPETKGVPLWKTSSPAAGNRPCRLTKAGPVSPSASPGVAFLKFAVH
ncbi:MAG: hypothetical protein MUC91_06300 [Verrucomicrobia bacterium]|nr:hypothetical protein [Verrucomicrobiota bacterium]